MRKPNEIHLNGNNSTVQIASAHETSKVQVFNSPIFGKIRVSTDKNGDPLFCLVDICTSIGIFNNRVVKTRLDKDDVCLIDTIDNLGRNQHLTFVTESGMYDVVLRSDSPQAKPFRKWVTKDVLPTIRKIGSYSIQPQHNIPQTYSDALLLAANQARQIENLKEENHLLVLVISELYFSENIANSTNSCIFAVLTVQQTLLLRRAAVNCSIVIGRFLCSIFKDIKRLSIRSHCFVLRSKVCWTVSSVYGNRFSVAYNDLNAYSHGK